MSVRVRGRKPLVHRESMAGNNKPLFLGSRSSGTTLLEALPAKHWPSLRRFKRHSRLLAAVRAGSARFYFLIAVLRCRADSSSAFCLTRLAALGLVLELFIVEEKLFASREEKLRAAVDALQQPVLEFHVDSPRRPPRNCANSSALRRGNPIRKTLSQTGFGPPFRLRNGYIKLFRGCNLFGNDKGRLAAAFSGC